MEQRQGHAWLAAILPLAMWPLRRLRGKAVAPARGRVLEIGAGTGLNFGRYEAIESLVATDPDPHMVVRARRGARGLGFPIEVHEAPAEELPFPAASFDTVVATWVFCTVDDPIRAAMEVSRVLRPGGRFLFVEHVRSEQAGVARVQDAITPLWARIAGGCHLNRDFLACLRAAGLGTVRVRPCGRLRWTLVPMILGEAERPAA